MLHNKCMSHFRQPVQTYDCKSYHSGGVKVMPEPVTAIATLFSRSGRGGLHAAQIEASQGRALNTAVVTSRSTGGDGSRSTAGRAWGTAGLRRYLVDSTCRGSLPATTIIASGRLHS